MAAITAYLKGKYLTSNHGAAFDLSQPVKKWPENGYAFSTVGDSLTLNLNWLDWITGISSYTFATTNETGTRTFTVTFQYSTDGGTTWSAAAGIAGLTGLSFPAGGAEFFHLRLIFVRSGATTTGTLYLNGFRIQGTRNYLNRRPEIVISPMTYNSTQDSFGVFGTTENVGIISQVTSLISRIAEDMPNTFARSKRYKFFYGHPDFCKPDNTTPYIFAYDVRMSQQATSMRNEVKIQFKTGVKRTPDSTNHPGENDVFDQYMTRVTNFFGPNWQSYVFDQIKLRDVWNFGVTMADLGVQQARSFGSFTDYGGKERNVECNWPASWETVVELTVYPSLIQNFVNF